MCVVLRSLTVTSQAIVFRVVFTYCVLVIKLSRKHVHYQRVHYYVKQQKYGRIWNSFTEFFECYPLLKAVYIGKHFRFRINAPPSSRHIYSNCLDLESRNLNRWLRRTNRLPPRVLSVSSTLFVYSVFITENSSEFSLYTVEGGLDYSSYWYVCIATDVGG